MKNKENAVCISWVDPSIRNLFNILLKEKEKRGKKIFSWQLFETRAT